MMELPFFGVLHGDCRQALRGAAADTFHAIVTDPPYGLGFMGKEWDHGVPSGEFWREFLRVAKPGAHLVAFGGTRTWHRLACAIEDAGWEIRDSLCWMYGQGFPKSKNLGDEWSGWGTALKPAHEPIVLARKPLVGTVALNVLAHGTGAINVDGCRLEAGRWPANIALDEEAAALLDEQVGTLTSGEGAVRRRSGSDDEGNTGAAFGAESRPAGSQMVSYGDAGGASRFFYVAKAPPAERWVVRRCRCGSVVEPRAACRDASCGLCGEKFERVGHPTQKPIALMRWLVRLVTPPGGYVLDPFVGSGTSLVAAIEEGFDCLGVDLDADHVAVARARAELARPGGA